MTETNDYDKKLLDEIFLVEWEILLLQTKKQKMINSLNDENGGE